jgi:hypothetical protein
MIKVNSQHYLPRNRVQYGIFSSFSAHPGYSVRVLPQDFFRPIAPFRALADGKILPRSGTHRHGSPQGVKFSSIRLSRAALPAGTPSAAVACVTQARSKDPFIDDNEKSHFNLLFVLWAQITYSDEGTGVNKLISVPSHRAHEVPRCTPLFRIDTRKDSLLSSYKGPQY